MNTFPEYPLVAINSLAERLLSSKDRGDLEGAESVKLELAQKIEALSESISSMNVQLRPRRTTETDKWRVQCKFNLAQANKKLESLIHLAAQARKIVNHLSAMQSRVDVAHEKTERYRINMNEHILLLGSLKSILKKQMSNIEYIKLLKKATRDAGLDWESDN